MAMTQKLQHSYVAPHVGAWIEIRKVIIMAVVLLSHPTWVRGLKSESEGAELPAGGVAPHVGAWIEIYPRVRPVMLFKVAPHVGAWIEIVIRYKSIYYKERRTPRGCVD